MATDKRPEVGSSEHKPSTNLTTANEVREDRKEGRAGWRREGEDGGRSRGRRSERFFRKLLSEKRF